MLIPMILLMCLGVSSSWDPINLQLYKARSAVKKSDNRQASLAYAAAAGYSPWRLDFWELAGIFALETGNPQEAKSYLSRVSHSGELSAAGLKALGDIQKSEGDMQSAIKSWERAVLLTGDDIDLHTRLVNAYRQNEDLSSAVQHLSRISELEPTDIETNYQLGLLLAATKPEAALAYLTLAAELDPSLAENTSQLIQNIRFARNADDPSYSLVSAGQSLLSLEEWELAEIALEHAVEINPEYSDAWAYLGEALQHTGQGGFEEISNALHLDPESLAANTIMGLYWQRQDRFDLALIYLYAASQLDERNPALQAEIGNTLGQMGNLPSAEIHYRQSVELAPKNPSYWRMLANYYIQYETKLRDEGLAAARQAVILDPENPESLDVMAQIYLLLDNPLIAQRFLAKALSIDSGYAPAHLHMGLIHIIEGKSLEAYQRFSLARDLSDPESETAIQANRLLQTHFP
ncbi:MAG: hypothetical protein JSV42_06050 [Chloroflexota bacterium]|nr:MAG: hypothetical protein JSV42_06050 [Chloroflexota bacterium]